MMEVPSHVVRKVILHCLQTVRGRVLFTCALPTCYCRTTVKRVLNNMPTPLDRALNSRVSFDDVLFSLVLDSGLGLRQY
jgi:hypothetical protein